MHLLRHTRHEFGADKGAFGAQGNAHHGGHGLQAVVVVVLEGEDVGVARGAKERLFERTGLIDYFIEHVVGGHTRLALDNEEGVGLDKDHVELVVVLGAGTRDAHADGYLLWRDKAHEGVIYILLKPAAGEIIHLIGLEHVLLLGGKPNGIEQCRKAGNSITAVATAEGDVVDGHGLAHAAIDKPELLKSLEGTVGQPTGAEAVEDTLRIVLAAGRTMASLLQVVAEAVETEILVERHAVADGVDSIGAVVVSAVERGIDHKVLTCLHVEEACVELGKNMLDGQSQITGATSQVDPIGDIGREPREETAADALEDIAVLVTLEGDEIHLVVGQVEQGGITAKQLAVFGWR